MANTSSRDGDRLVTRFEVHVCRPEGSQSPAALLHTLFRVHLKELLVARFCDAVGAVEMRRSDEEAAWYSVRLVHPVPAVTAAFCADAAATAAGVSIPGGHIRVFPGDLDVSVSEANDIPCAAA